MKKVLFVLHEGITATIFDSQVIEHIKYGRNFGYEFEILAFNTENAIWKKSLENLKKYKHFNIILKRAINIYMPLSHVINFFLLFSAIYKKRKTYDFVHARANYTAFLVGIFCKIFKIPFVWDCRGDSVAELKQALENKSYIKKKYGYCFLLPIDRLQIEFLSRYANGALFVSEELYKLYEKKLATKNYQIVPCLVNENLFYYDVKLREKMRLKYKIDKDTKVFLYSGSMVTYQGLDNQMSFIKKILNDNNSILFYLTSDIQKALVFFGDVLKDKVIIKSVPFKEMNNYYCLADYAILLRPNDNVNKVASPTKFGEYCITGLKVIMNQSVVQAYKNSLIITNFVSENEEFFFVDNNHREDISNRSKKVYSRYYQFPKYLKLYGKL